MKNADFRSVAKIIFFLMAVIHFCWPILQQVVNLYLSLIELIQIWTL